MFNKKITINLISLIIFLGLLSSLINNFYQIKRFDNLQISMNNNERHVMINQDIEDFWREGNKITKQLKSGIPYLETGGEYRRPYLPARTFALFSTLLSKELYSENGKVSLNNNKIIILVVQSIFYYILIFFLSIKLLEIFSKRTSQIIIFFLAFEPTLFLFHSSFWSESIFFSLQILILIFMLKNNHNIISLFLFGLTLGVFYLQRSVAIYYIFPVLIYYYFNNNKNFIKYFFSITIGFIVILSLVGLHNLKRADIFYVTSTQAKDGWYIYLVPDILGEKTNTDHKIISQNLEKKTNEWIAEKNLDLKNEKDKIEYYNYTQKIAFNVMLNNPIITLKHITKRTLHFLVVDPLSHVYYFHRYAYKALKNGHYYKSVDHKKWIIPRIIYSIIIYFFSLIGLFVLLKNKKHRMFSIYIFLSILYFTLVQSWHGNTRYFSPILIYLSFFFANGLNWIFERYVKNNN